MKRIVREEQEKMTRLEGNGVLGEMIGEQCRNGDMEMTLALVDTAKGEKTGHRGAFDYTAPGTAEEVNATATANRWKSAAGSSIFPFSKGQVAKCRSREQKEMMFNKIYTWTLNASRANTGLPPLQRDAELAFGPWNRWKLFISPLPPPDVMKKIEAMSREDREKLYDARRWFETEKILMGAMKKGKWVLWGLVWAPIVMFVLVSVFSLEKVPFTGR